MNKQSADSETLNVGNRQWKSKWFHHIHLLQLLICGTLVHFSLCRACMCGFYSNFLPEFPEICYHTFSFYDHPQNLQSSIFILFCLFGPQGLLAWFRCFFCSNTTDLNQWMNKRLLQNMNVIQALNRVCWSRKTSQTCRIVVLNWAFLKCSWSDFDQDCLKSIKHQHLIVRKCYKSLIVGLI